MSKNRTLKVKPVAFGRRSKQGGFVPTMLIGGIVLLGVLVAAYAYFNRNSAANFDSEQHKVNASIVIATGNDVRTAVSRWLQDYTGTPVLNDVAGNVFDPALGLGSKRSLPPKVFAAGAAVDFAYNTADIVVGSGDTVAEATIVLPGLRTEVCQQINRLINDMAISAAVPSTVIPSGEGCSSVSLGGAAATNTYYKVVEFRR